MNDELLVSLAVDTATVVLILGTVVFIAKLISELWHGFQEN